MMNSYDYREAMKADVLDHIRYNFTAAEIAEKLTNRSDWENELYDDLWICDGVTGNASGSYTFNRWKAKEYVIDNMGELFEALREFCVDLETIGKKFMDESWEYFDVTIRCHLLMPAIYDALDELDGRNDG